MRLSLRCLLAGSAMLISIRMACHLLYSAEASAGEPRGLAVVDDAAPGEGDKRYASTRRGPRSSKSIDAKNREH